MMNLEELNALLDETATVESGGVNWTVGDPNQKEAMSILRRFIATADMEDDDERVNEYLSIYTEAIRACVRIDGLERLSEDQAGRILYKSGGSNPDNNALSRACMGRCGVSYSKAEDESEADFT